MKPILFAILAGLCWGIGEIYTKSALNSREVGPLAAFLIRALVTLPLALIAYTLATRGLGFTQEVPNWFRTATTATWLKLILGSGLLAGFAGVFFFYSALSMKGGDISILRPIAFSLAPASAVLLGWLMLGEEMTLRKAAAVVLIITGIILLSGPERSTESDPGARDVAS